MTEKSQAPEGALRQVLRELETARDYITKSLEGAKEAYQGHPDRWAAEERDLADTDAAIAAGRAALAAQPEPGTAQWCAKCGEGVTPGLCRRKDALAYQQANPLGGPAKVFRAMADAIEAGDSYEDTLRRFEYAEVKPSPAEGDAPATGDVWLKHDDDLRFVARVLSGGLQAPEADIKAAREIVHGLRTTARSHVQPKGTAADERMHPGLVRALADRHFRGATDAADLYAMAANVIREDGQVLAGQRTLIDTLKARAVSQAPAPAPEPGTPYAWIGDRLRALGHTDLAESADWAHRDMAFLRRELAYERDRRASAQCAAPGADDQWRDAVDQQLILCELTVANFATPADAVRGLLDWHAMAAREVDSTSAAPAPVKPPKHKFWGAGEADCPADIKGRNGELHSLRCKVCGETNPPDEFCWTAATQAPAVTDWKRTVGRMARALDQCADNADPASHPATMREVATRLSGLLTGVEFPDLGAAQPAKVNRYCRAGMCVATDAKHEPDCAASHPPVQGSQP